MSSDLQRAGNVFGCHAMLHVVGKDPFPKRLRDATPGLFFVPLDPEDAPAVFPVVIGRGSRAEMLDVPGGDGDGDRVCARAFPVELAPPARELADVVTWTSGSSGSPLDDEIAERERESFQVLGNYLDGLTRDEPHESWRMLYRLPPAVITRLRETRLGPEHAGWVKKLPRAELHCHLGGLLDLPAQQRVARALWETLPDPERRKAERSVSEMIASAERGEQWPWDWPERLREGASPAERTAACAALLRSLNEETLEHQLFSPTLPRVGLAGSKGAHPHGFEAYERPGELSGSALLGDERAIAPYAEEVRRAIRQEGLWYVELRASPDKYLGGNADRFVELFRDAIEQCRGPDDAQVKLLWSLDRRWEHFRVTEAVSAAVAVARKSGGFVVGFDLAGAEEAGAAEALSSAFEPAFHECMPITIHAGEGEKADSIWSATYALHADRVGHGLSLPENRELAEKLRNRGVCVEVCPTSNREVVGFEDPDVEESRGLPRHPLARMLDLGLPVAICADNPSTSRTTHSRELLAASRMCGGLTRWQILALTRQSFVHAFLPAADRRTLLRRADAHLFQLLASSGA